MAEKNFMSSAVNESAAETARLARNSITQKVDQSAAETARLVRSGSLAVGPQLDQTAAETKRLNQYSFQPNNVVPNSDQANEETLKLKFQSNILDNYDTVSYHAKLFLTTPDASRSGQILDVKNQTVIAESGVTDLTIDNIEIRSVATPTIETGTGVATTVSFDIFEPSGAGMIDQIYYQSIGLGIGNWSVAPFYLQMSFRSRDPETSQSIDNPVGAIDDLTWVYPLKMGDIKANVTSVGTHYQCSAVVYNEIAQNNAYSSMQQATRLQNLQTVGEALQELQDKLNIDQLYRLIGTYSIPDSFRIVVDPAIAGYKVTPSTSNENSIRNNNYAVFDGKDATFAAGTSIDKIIDAILSNTKEYQTLVIGANVAGQEGQPINAETNQMKKFWRIYTETRPLKYDIRRSDNSREFTFFVYQYDIGILDQNSSQTANGAQTKSAMKRRLSTYLKKSILKKKYNYIFTGKNDQIIDFNLDMNCAFAIGKARLAGVYSNLAMASKGVVTQTNSADEAAVTEQLVKTISFLNDSANTNEDRRNYKIKDTVMAINASTLPSDQKQRYLKILETAKSSDKLTTLSQAQISSGINNDGTLNTNQFNPTNLAIRKEGNSSNNAVPSFISDVNINSPQTKAALSHFLEYNKGKLRPTVFVESMQDKSVGLGIESNSDSGQQKLSSMFSVALHGTYGGSLQAIRMTIKGDPFWMFPYPIQGTNRSIYNSLKSADEAINWLKSNHLRTNSANLVGTDNFFVLRFRTPRNFQLEAEAEYSNSESGQLVDSETFSGIYKVTTVVNRFHVGRFEQDIQAIIDPVLRLSDFSKELEDDNRSFDTPTSPDDLVGETAVPANSVKKEIIMGSNTTKIPGIDQTVNKIPGVTTVTANVNGAITTTTQTIRGGTETIKSNIPSAINTFPGLPPKYIG
jgi:hypothetical protein